MRLNQEQVLMEMGTLPERFADRLPEQDLQDIVEPRNAGEWFLTWAYLVAALHRNRATISTREVRSLRDLSETFQESGPTSDDLKTRILTESNRWLDELRVIPSLTEQQMIDRLRAIPQKLADRITPRESDLLTVKPDEEEPGIWFEVGQDLTKVLRKHRVPVSEEERTELWLILDALDLPRQELTQLPAT